jgi:hypothetical protein
MTNAAEVRRMMEREPYWFRSPEHRYCLGTNTEYGWTTGIAEDGRQVLHNGKYRIAFDPEGTLLGLIDSQPISCDLPISVLRFWIPDIWVGVEDLPESLADYFLNPDEFSQEPNDVDLWLLNGMFVFNNGWSDYYVSREGRVETS